MSFYELSIYHISLIKLGCIVWARYRFLDLLSEKRSLIIYYFDVAWSASVKSILLLEYFTPSIVGSFFYCFANLLGFLGRDKIIDIKRILVLRVMQCFLVCFVIEVLLRFVPKILFRILKVCILIKISSQHNVIHPLLGYRTLRSILRFKLLSFLIFLLLPLILHHHSPSPFIFRLTLSRV